ncbi:unnamed protein product [Didymodactylos carnosus]|uniref:Reverse transcriptase domain-containing protein n=1 Tax=Didymodactylos carnosus TaxID=1234261 RepID=A0A8S2FDP2_9BILA|nr:unnamed protein product [Didymodactylos carnosus]CAF4231913.1 unnamed protein product [Didymodactylos carnosus]
MGKNEDCSSDSIEYKRYKMRRDDYWVALLHSERDERHYPTTTTAYDGYDDGNGIVNMKQKLLYLVNVEIQLHQQLRPQQPFTVVCADMEWFGPSISHEVVQILLEVCGIPRIWLDFFDRFLKMPVYYQPGEPIRIRQRGCPMSHSLSFLFAELLLFAMDLYVYRNTQIFNYRLHDDFWFFDSQSENIQKAWQLMCEYADLTGLKLNKEKCGSIKIGDNATAAQSFGDAALPQNHVKWGFLYLQSNGRFTIQNDLLVPYLNEMKERLNGAKSIMAWVTIYNKYVAFFLRNFGKCANVLGTYHTQQTIKAFQYIHQYLFPDAHGNALTVLMQLIVDQFKPITNSSSDLSECWFYWPLTKGGLGLTNVYLEVFAIHIQLEMNAKLETFSTLPIKDKQLYDDLIIHFQSLIKKRSFDLSKQFPDRYLHDDNTFITFDEYIKQREAYMPHWTHVYETLLEITQPALPQPTSIVNKYHLSQRRRRTRNISMNDAYSEWLAYYYGQQLEDTFNQLDFIDSQSLPIGLISTMKASQINWDKGRKVYKRQHSSDTR